MQKLLRAFFLADRRRRSLAVELALWLLRIIWDIERSEADRFYDRLVELDSDSQDVSPREYAAAEENCSLSEFTRDYLESAIEDLEFAY